MLIRVNSCYFVLILVNFDYFWSILFVCDANCTGEEMAENMHNISKYFENPSFKICTCEIQ